MIWAMLGLLAGFILVLAFLYYLLLKTDLSVGLKLVSIVVVTVFYWVQYQTLQQYMGWPATDDLPAEFVLIATDIHEPNKKTGEAGVMYWWGRDSADTSQPPRVYQLPFESSLHKQTDEVVEEQKKGSLYVGRRSSEAATSNSLGVSFEKISKASQNLKD